MNAFNAVDTYKDALYNQCDALRLPYLSLLSQNLWEGFCAFRGQTSGHTVVAYTGPYSVI